MLGSHHLVIKILKNNQFTIKGCWEAFTCCGVQSGYHWSSRIPSTTISSKSAWVLLDSTHSLLWGFTLRVFFLGAIGMDLDLEASSARFALRSGFGCWWHMEECTKEEEWRRRNGGYSSRKKKQGGGNMQLLVRSAGVRRAGWLYKGSPRRSAF